MNLRFRGVVASLLTLTALACGGGSLRMSGSYVAVHNTMAAMGLAQSGEISEGSLGEGAVARVMAHFVAGDCYTIVAFGSGGVGNLNVRVTDDGGVELAADRNEDRQAATQFCPDRSGDYQVSVEMASGSGGYVLSSWSGLPMSSAGGAVASGGGSLGTCARPSPLRIGETVRGDTTGASSSMAGSCIQGGAAPERVYSFTLEERAQVSITQTSSYDGALYLLGTCGDVRSEIACNDDDGGTTRSRLNATLDPGTYYVVVDGYQSASGAYELVLETTALQSLAQVCGGALALTPGQPTTGTTAGQVNYFQASCAGRANSPERVYQMNVPTRSRLRVRMQTTSFDGALYVRRECADPGTEVVCNDDHGDTRHSLAFATVDPGTYYVYADGYSSNNAGDYSLRADLAPVGGGGGGPADTCATAGSVTAGQPVEMDTFSAADDYAGSCGGQGAPDAVYTLDVTSRVRLRARVLQTEIRGGVMYLQSQCGQQSSEVACSPLAGSALEATLTPGTYFLVVDGQNPESFGEARIQLEMDDLSALERTCRQARRVRPGRTVNGDTSGGTDRFHASCAGQARSPDEVYRLVLPRRRRVTVSSEQQFDGAIYIRSDCSDQSTEVACNDDSSDTRHSRIETTLDAGTYYVFVDGFSQNNSGQYDLRIETSAP